MFITSLSLPSLSRVASCVSVLSWRCLCVTVAPRARRRGGEQRLGGEAGALCARGERSSLAERSSPRNNLRNRGPRSSRAFGPASDCISPGASPTTPQDAECFILRRFLMGTREPCTLRIGPVAGGCGERSSLRQIRKRGPHTHEAGAARGMRVVLTPLLSSSPSVVLARECPFCDL